MCPLGTADSRLWRDSPSSPESHRFQLPRTLQTALATAVNMSPRERRLSQATESQQLSKSTESAVGKRGEVMRCVVTAVEKPQTPFKTLSSCSLGQFIAVWSKFVCKQILYLAILHESDLRPVLTHRFALRSFLCTMR